MSVYFYVLSCQLFSCIITCPFVSMAELRFIDDFFHVLKFNLRYVPTEIGNINVDMHRIGTSWAHSMGP